MAKAGEGMTAIFPLEKRDSPKMSKLISRSINLNVLTLIIYNGILK